MTDRRFEQELMALELMLEDLNQESTDQDELQAMAIMRQHLKQLRRQLVPNPTQKSPQKSLRVVTNNQSSRSP